MRQINLEIGMRKILDFSGDQSLKLKLSGDQYYMILSLSYKHNYNPYYGY